MNDRVFVPAQEWENISYSVVEKDGTQHLFPDEEWAREWARSHDGASYVGRLVLHSRNPH